MTGPKPTPTRVKRLRGTLRADRVRGDEPIPEPADDAFDQPPAEIADDEVAADEWRRLVPPLRKLCIVTELDRSALIAACSTWSLYRRALAIADGADMTTRRGTGALTVHPAMIVASRALSLLLKLWPELGLTPAGRSRVGTVQPPAIDDFSEFDTPADHGGRDRRSH